ncbi:IMP dehydrogenase [Candidatus Nomurabacteria bacterium]|nr:IMP dehydrogenase [Candidatus Nomurabacteria bacterium]
MDLSKLIEEAIKYADKFKSYDGGEVYNTYSDVSIIPTYLTKVSSRRDVDIQQEFNSIRNKKYKIFPAFGASMSFMRSKMAVDLAKQDTLHVLPRIGLTYKERLADIDKAGERVGATIGLNEDDEFIEQLIQKKNLYMIAISIAQAANHDTIKQLQRLSKLGIKNGVMPGTVGSVRGLAFLYNAMDNLGYEEKIIRVCIGGGAGCLTRLNAGVGVGSFTLIEKMRSFIDDQGINDLKIITDGGIKFPGEFVKALTKCEGAMMGGIFASESMEDSVLEKVDGNLMLKYTGNASKETSKSHRYVEGGVIYKDLNAKYADEIVLRLKDGLQSAMTYVNAINLDEFRQQVTFVSNSLGSIRESALH